MARPRFLLCVDFIVIHLCRGFARGPASASKPAITSNSFLVNACLTYSVEGGVEGLQQIINIFIGAFHRARRLAFSLASDSAQARKMEMKKVFADERTQSHGAAAHDFGQQLRRPGNFGQTCLPLRVKRQQALADRS